MLIVLDKTGQKPLYEQIVEEIRARILSGRLKPGESLPSIRQLAADLSISVITTKRAYLELENRGLIRTHPGLGSFVVELDPESVRTAGLDEVRARLEEAVRAALRLGLPAEGLAALLGGLIAEILASPGQEGKEETPHE